jgi:multidrug efflux system outer membrane protein
METTMTRIAMVMAFAIALAGCTTTPTAPPQLDLPPAAGDVPPLTRWWTAFDDPMLDKLIDEALANNLDLRAAITRVDQARAFVLRSQSDLFPTVDLGAGAARARSTERGTNPLPPGFSPYSNDFRVGLQASYELDLWGKYRTATRAAQSDLLASEYARETVRTAVAAETARAYFSLLTADAQLALLAETLASRDQSVELQRDRYEAGIIGDYDFSAALAERASVAGDIALAKRAVSELESALAVLLGRSPREVFTPVVARNVEIARMTRVPEIPSGLPSDMLARRPDIRRAEAQLAAANMRIDVARADYYPSISLTGLFGTEAGALKNLFSAGSLVWSIAGSLAQPLLGLKAIEANVLSATTRRDEVVIDYVKTVQGAFRDAHDALSLNETSREALAAQNDRRQNLERALELSDVRYSAGYSPYLEVLDAQRQLLQAQTLQILAARNVRLAVVDLAKALGGGWDYEAGVEPPGGVYGFSMPAR